MELLDLIKNVLPRKSSAKRTEAADAPAAPDPAKRKTERFRLDDPRQAPPRETQAAPASLTRRAPSSFDAATDDGETALRAAAENAADDDADPETATQDTDIEIAPEEPALAATTETPPHHAGIASAEGDATEGGDPAPSARPAAPQSSAATPPEEADHEDAAGAANETPQAAEPQQESQQAFSAVAASLPPSSEDRPASVIQPGAEHPPTVLRSPPPDAAPDAASDAPSRAERPPAPAIALSAPPPAAASTPPATSNIMSLDSAIDLTPDTSLRADRAADVDVVLSPPALKAAAQAAATRAPAAAVAHELLAAVRKETKTGAIEIRLDPPELGKVQLRFNFERADGAAATIIAERAETLDLLRRNAGALLHELERAGLANVDIEFSLSANLEGFPDAEPDGETVEGLDDMPAGVRNIVYIARDGAGMLNRIV